MKDKHQNIQQKQQNKKMKPTWAKVLDSKKRHTQAATTIRVLEERGFMPRGIKQTKELLCLVLSIV